MQTATAEQDAATHRADTLHMSIRYNQAATRVDVNPPIYPTTVTCAGVVRVITTDTITKTIAMTSTVTSTPPAETTNLTTELTSSKFSKQRLHRPFLNIC